MKAILSFGFYFIGFLGSLTGQVADSADVVRQLDSLILISRKLTGQREYEKALEVLDVAEQIAIDRFGRQSGAFASICFNYGRVFREKKDFNQAEKRYLDVIEFYENSFDTLGLRYASALSGLAILYSMKGGFNNLYRGEWLFLRALSIREKKKGRNSAEYAEVLSNLITNHRKMDKEEEAMIRSLELKDILAKTGGIESKEYASCLTTIGDIYIDAGDYEAAEKYLLEAKSILGKESSQKGLDYALCQKALGTLYREMGMYANAEASFLDAKQIFEKTTGKENPNYAGNLNGLAVLYRKTGNYQQAELMFQETIELWAKLKGKESTDYATTLGNFAIMYADLQLYEKAEQFYLESKKIFEVAWGTESAAYARSLNNLAVLYSKTGDYAKAKQCGLQAIAIRKKVLGQQHPNVSSSLINLVNLYWKMNEYYITDSLFNEVSELNKLHILNATRYLSEQEMNKYLIRFTSAQHQLFSFTQVFSSEKSQHISNDEILFQKGYLYNAAFQIKNKSRTDSLSNEQFNLLKSYHRRLATQYSLPISDRDSALISDLEEKANTLEKELVRTVAGFGEALRQVTWQEVQQQLRPGEAAIEFVHYNFYTPWPTDSIMYAALVLKPGDTTPHFVPLFEERQIALLLKGASGGNDRKINGLYGSKGQDLFALIWKPVESLLTGINTVYISPSGLLHRLNLGAIPAPGQQTFGERRRVITLGSTRQLVPAANYQAPVNAALSAAVFGGIRYETDTTAMPASEITDVAATRGVAEITSFYRDSALRSGSLNYLPGSRTEALDVARLLQKARYTVQLDTGYSATEEAFHRLGRGQAAPRILHVATHGFFYPDPKDPVANRSSLFEQENTVFRQSDNPMMRAGLLLAGANQAWLTGKGPENREDGILTAYEISHLDLSGTELVVLSACETGLGDIEGNEGVYGLQRAFKIAGAKYLMMSLWKVSDNITREFMTEFYRLWLEDKQAIPDAFRGAQAYMKKKYPGSPFHWAGFVLVE